MAEEIASVVHRGSITGLAFSFQGSEAGRISEQS